MRKICSLHMLTNRWGQFGLALVLSGVLLVLSAAILLLPSSEAAPLREHDALVSSSPLLNPAGPVVRSITTQGQVTHTLYLPFVAKNWMRPIAMIEWESPDGYQPLDGAIVPTTTLTVRITLLLDLDTVQVTLTPGGGYPEDITDQFPDLLATGQSTATLTLPVGDYTLTVEGTVNDQQVSQSAGMVTFDSTVMVVGPGEILPIVADTNAWVEKDTVIVIFERGTDYLEMSQVLRDAHLKPVGFNLVTNGVRARIIDGRSPSDVAAVLASKPSVQAATPNFAVQLPDTLGENMPARLRNSYRARASARCTAPAGDLRGCFDYDGPDGTNELRIFRHHFFMDTFAGHRLVDHLVGANPALRVAIADIDTGLGNGANPTDIPIDATGLYGFSRAPFRWDNAGNQIGAGALGIADVRDTAPNGHGTQVVAAAVGRGAQVLGTGKDLRMRPIRYTGPAGGTWQDFADGLIGACRDSAVVVVVMEIWNRLDNPEPFVDNNGNGQWDPGEPLTDWNGDGVWTDVDGVIAPAERAAHAGWVPGIVNILQPAINFCRNPFVDTNRNGTYQPGEPFADTDGDGVFNPDRDGKILAAPLGNDGENLDLLQIPSRFVPGRPRPAAAPFVFGISASETMGAADGVNNVRGPEGLAHYSNFGPRVSVSAPGTEIVLPDPTGNLRAISGTSFATPIAAGLVGEMIFLDRNLQPPRGLFSPLQIIEILEATADDLGSTVNANNAAKPNDSPGNDRDDAFGHGRINVWKAILAVANRGLARESHDVNPQGYATDFPSLPTITDEDTLWYGFKIHSPVHEATVWLDGVRLTDAGSTAPGAPNITAYAGV
ncbi:MAG TPA: hypothetical protein EYP49_07915, partial [Anaerolineae bacterium]|nr:hypothetical protein [Anaerolineae bacterium]